MDCSNALADAWLTIVIPAAISSAPVTDDATSTTTASGNNTLKLDLGRPLETLHALEGFDWTAHGVCADCAADRRAEWRTEREAMWTAMDSWLGL